MVTTSNPCVDGGTPVYRKVDGSDRSLRSRLHAEPIHRTSYACRGYVIKSGEIIYARDGLAIMVLPNGLLVGDKVIEVPETDRDEIIEGMLCAMRVLSHESFGSDDTSRLKEVPHPTWLKGDGPQPWGMGYAKVMYLVDDPKQHLWAWLQGETKCLFATHSYIGSLMVAKASGQSREGLPHPF